MDRSAGSNDTRTRILAAAEALLRRHGPAKTNVVDVARALGMSHANVYRHFASKAALMDTLVDRWLKRGVDELTAIAEGPGAADERLADWVLAQIAIKRARVLDDPEMFEAYHAAAEARSAVAQAYVDGQRGVLVGMIREGVETEVFPKLDPEAAADALVAAMTRFFHPYFLKLDGDAPKEAEARRVLAIMIAGMKAGAV